MKISNWTKRIQDRVRWNAVAEKAKTFNSEVVAPEEKKK